MPERLAAIVLGHRNSGKSTTWNTLFEKVVRTGANQRQLKFNSCESASVFLVSGSPEERRTYIGRIISDEDPAIILSSLQYRADVEESFAYFRDHGYQLYVQWINPGYSDDDKYGDSLGLLDKLLAWGATITVVNGKGTPEQRVKELRNFVYGWAKPRSLVSTMPW